MVSLKPYSFSVGTKNIEMNHQTKISFFVARNYFNRATMYSAYKIFLVIGGLSSFGFNQYTCAVQRGP